MTYERETQEIARGGLVRPASLGGQAGVGATEKVMGSLAEAFERLEKEIILLENSCKTLFERVNPFLEPAPPSDQSVKEAVKGGSPLAEAVFEYVTRIRRQRQGFEEIAHRIAY